MAEPQQSAQLDIWQVVPPEEKLELMARAQAAGVVACIIAVIIASTIAVSLKLNWILWGGLMACPFIFQFSAGKKWRDIRPRTMLEYLAARSASRRYAFMTHSKNLGLQLLFKGKISRKFDQDQVLEALEAVVNKTDDIDVWVALFNDTVVMISEQAGGAKVEFAHLINERLGLSSTGPKDTKSDYSSGRALNLTSMDKKGGDSQSWILTSRYPAALIVFEKKLRSLLESGGEAGAGADGDAIEEEIDESSVLKF